MNGEELQARVLIGGQLYRVARDWAPVPDGIGKGFISTLATDSAGCLYVLRRGVNPPVLVHAPDGSFLRGFGDGLVYDAHGIFIDAADRVFVVDRDAHQVICFSTAGEVLFTLGERHMPRWNKPFNHPTDAAIGPDGEIFVADGYSNACIHVFSPEGEHVRSFGSVGHGRGQMMNAHALLVDAEGRVVVADRENDRVQVFDRRGEWLAEYHGMSRPMDVFERADGVLLVSDVVPNVSAFAPNGVRIDRGRASLTGAHGITGDRAGNLYLAEINPNSITLLRPA